MPFSLSPAQLAELVHTVPGITAVHDLPTPQELAEIAVGVREFAQLNPLARYRDPMTVDDALFQMELVGHDFYLFHDKESGRPSVVYRRRGYDYGILSLEATA